MLDTYRPLIEDAFFELNGIVKENFRQVDDVSNVCKCNQMIIGGVSGTVVNPNHNISDLRLDCVWTDLLSLSYEH